MPPPPLRQPLIDPNVQPPPDVMIELPEIIQDPPGLIEPIPIPPRPDTPTPESTPPPSRSSSKSSSKSLPLAGKRSLIHPSFANQFPVDVFTNAEVFSPRWMF